MSMNYESVSKINSLKSQIETFTNKTYDNLTQGVQELKNLYVKYGKSFDDIVGHIDIPSTCTKIRPFCFYGMQKLTSVTIPNSVISIGADAFELCEKLNNVSISNSVLTIGHSAFYYCRSLTSITIPDSVITIDGSAFYNCSNLSSVVIGNSVTTINDGAFSNCTNLTHIYLNPTTPPRLGNAITIPTTTTIHVPVGCGDAYKSATNWSSHAERIIEDPEL